MGLLNLLMYVVCIIALGCLAKWEERAYPWVKRLNDRFPRKE